MSLLDGLRVVQVGHAPALDFAGWIFAQSGAEVSCAPAPDGAALDRLRAAFCGVAKTLIEPAALGELAASADVVLAGEDFDWDLCGPQTLTGTTVAFPASSEYEGWQASESVLAGLGGASEFTRSADGTPVYGVGARFQYLAGQLLYTALVAHLSSDAERLPAEHPRVVVNELETVTYLLPYATSQSAYNASTVTVEQSGPRFVVPCRDGHVAIYAGNRWADLAALLGCAEDDQRFAGVAARFAHVDDLEDLCRSWAAERSADEIEAAAIAHSVAIARVAGLSDVLADAELAAEEMWNEQSVDDLGSGRSPRLPYRVDGVRVGRSA